MLDYELIRCRRRSIALQVKANGQVVVRAPRLVSRIVIEKFITAKEKWINRHVLEQARRQQEQLDTPLPEISKTQALALIAPRLEIFAAQMRLEYRGLKISNARSKWGSCTPGNVLFFSRALALAPLNVVDYVVVHELAHIAHKNHSLRFWRLVELHCPNFKSERTWLRRHGHLLMLPRS